VGGVQHGRQTGPCVNRWACSIQVIGALILPPAPTDTGNYIRVCSVFCKLYRMVSFIATWINRMDHFFFFFFFVFFFFFFCQQANSAQHSILAHVGTGNDIMLCLGYENYQFPWPSGWFPVPAQSSLLPSRRVTELGNEPVFVHKDAEGGMPISQYGLATRIILHPWSIVPGWVTRWIRTLAVIDKAIQIAKWLMLGR